MASAFLLGINSATTSSSPQRESQAGASITHQGLVFEPLWQESTPDLFLR